MSKSQHLQIPSKLLAAQEPSCHGPMKICCCHRKSQKVLLQSKSFFSALTLLCSATENPFPWNSADERAANMNGRFANFAVVCWTPHCPLHFSKKHLGEEERMRGNPIYSLLLIDFILSSFLLKINQRFSSLPQPFSIQFCIHHPLDHLLCMIVPFESSLLPHRKHLSSFFLYRLLQSYSSLTQVAVTSFALTPSPPLSTFRSQLIPLL